MASLQRLLLDDSFDFVALRAFADDASVAGRVLQPGSQNGHGRILGPVEVANFRDGRGGDQGSVARENQHVIVFFQCLAGDHHGVSCAALFGLQDEVHLSIRDRSADALGFIADDRVDIPRRHNPGRSRDYMRQQRLASDFMQDFRVFRLQARALTGRHDGNGKTRPAGRRRTGTRRLRLCLWHWSQYNASSAVGVNRKAQRRRDLWGIRRLRDQRNQVAGDSVGGMTGAAGFIQIVAQHRADT